MLDSVTDPGRRTPYNADPHILSASDVRRKGSLMGKRGIPGTPLAARLQELRNEKGLTQKELAGQLTSTKEQSTVSGWEIRKVPEPTALVELADFYDVDLRWLITGDGVRERREPPDAAIRLAAIRRIADPAWSAPDGDLVARLLRAKTLPTGGEGGGGEQKVGG